MHLKNVIIFCTFLKKLHKSKVRKLGSTYILGSILFSRYYGLNRDTFHDYLFIECWLYLVKDQSMATRKTYKLMAYREVSVFIVRIILNT